MNSQNLTQGSQLAVRQKCLGRVQCSALIHFASEFSKTQSACWAYPVPSPPMTAAAIWCCLRFLGSCMSLKRLAYRKLYRGAQMPWLGWHMGRRERRSGSYANCPSIAKSWTWLNNCGISLGVNTLHWVRPRLLTHESYTANQYNYGNNLGQVSWESVWNILHIDSSALGIWIQP